MAWHKSLTQWFNSTGRNISLHPWIILHLGAYETQKKGRGCGTNEGNVGLKTGGEKGNGREAYDAGSFRSSYRYKTLRLWLWLHHNRSSDLTVSDRLIKKEGQDLIVSIWGLIRLYKVVYISGLFRSFYISHLKVHVKDPQWKHISKLKISLILNMEMYINS